MNSMCCTRRMILLTEEYSIQAIPSLIEQPRGTLMKCFWPPEGCSLKKRLLRSPYTDIISRNSSRQIRRCWEVSNSSLWDLNRISLMGASITLLFILCYLSSPAQLRTCSSFRSGACRRGRICGCDAWFLLEFCQWFDSRRLVYRDTYHTLVLTSFRRKGVGLNIRQKTRVFSNSWGTT